MCLGIVRRPARSLMAGLRTRRAAVPPARRYRLEIGGRREPTRVVAGGYGDTQRRPCRLKITVPMSDDHHGLPTPADGRSCCTTRFSVLRLRKWWPQGPVIAGSIPFRAPAAERRDRAPALTTRTEARRAWQAPVSNVCNVPNRVIVSLQRQRMRTSARPCSFSPPAGGA